MNSEVVKFQSLKTNAKYTVLGHSNEYTSKYGVSYNLKVQKEGSNESFELWSTNLLTRYISEVEPKQKFSFTIKKKDGKKYPYIEGYNTVKIVHMLK